MSTFRDFILNKKVSQIINEADGQNKAQEKEEFQDNIESLKKGISGFIKTFRDKRINNKAEIFTITNIDIDENKTAFKKKDYSFGLNVTCKVLPDTQRSQSIQEMMDNCGEYLASDVSFVVNGEDKTMSYRGANIPTAIIGDNTTSGSNIVYKIALVGAFV